MTNISNQQLQAYYENLRRQQVYRAYAANYAKKEEPVEMVTLTVKRAFTTYFEGTDRTDFIKVNGDIVPKDEEHEESQPVTYSFVKGTTIQLEAGIKQEEVSSNQCYFKKWDDGVEDTERQIVMESDKTITAIFGTWM